MVAYCSCMVLGNHSRRIYFEEADMKRIITKDLMVDIISETLFDVVVS